MPKLERSEGVDLVPSNETETHRCPPCQDVELLQLANQEWQTSLPYVFWLRDGFGTVKLFIDLTLKPRPDNPQPKEGDDGIAAGVFGRCIRKRRGDVVVTD